MAEEGVYAVQHGRKPVQDFVFSENSDGPRHNLFEKAFLCLFPYG